MSSGSRHAIYLAPPAGSALESFAQRWLGRDHVSGAAIEPLQVEGIAPERLHEITASPRHYGFHATLKAPFELAEGRNEAELYGAAREFALTQRGFKTRLEPRSLKGFLALVPAEPSPQLDRLAADCVRHFEPFRAVLSGDEIARRRKSALTPRQDAHMLTWGYPYVFEDFRFHMTLTQRLSEPEHGHVLSALRALMAAITAEPMPIREIAIYSQSARECPFVLAKRFAFAG